MFKKILKNIQERDKFMQRTLVNLFLCLINLNYLSGNLSKKICILFYLFNFFYFIIAIFMSL